MRFTQGQYDLLLKELFAKHPTVQTVGFGGGAYKPGLEGMMRFDGSLGHPWKNYPTIHVAGTNGKGSVSSMLAAGLAADGMRVGLYTSPHLIDFRERVKLIASDGWSMIPERDVWDFLHGHDLDGLSFFEITTGLAFLWFAKQKVDAAVIETGLGGRLDSTNVIIPDLSIVTSIGLDHCALLGDTRAKIAAEKAGIFKPGVAALVAGRDEETEWVFEESARAAGSPLFFTDDFDEPDFPTDLAGPYQDVNLHTVLAALELMGVDADREALAHTAAVTGLRGRWEKVLDKPETICDIGHNPAALKLNFGRLEASGRPLFIVYGVMADKDINAIRPLMPTSAKYFLVAPDTPRALAAEKLADIMAGLDFTVAGSVAEGTQMALDATSNVPDGILYIGGSNFVVAEAIPFIEKHIICGHSTDI